MARAVIPIQPALAAEPVARPLLQGPADAVQRVLHGLRRVGDDDGGNLVDRQWIRSLSLVEGEVDLTLSLSARSAEGRRLCEQAFAELRRLLPDTDVYVHATR